MAFLLVAWAVPQRGFAADDDLLFLEPASKSPTRTYSAPSPAPTAASTALPTALPTAVPAAPTVAPTAAPTAVSGPLAITSIKYSRLSDGVKVWMRGNGALAATVGVLHSPERLWLRFPGATLKAPKRLEIHAGPVLRVRSAPKTNETHVVIDLDRPMAYTLLKDSPDVFALRLETGPLDEYRSGGQGLPGDEDSPAPQSGTSRGAIAPRIDMMLFDRNVLFQGKQYEAYPCANLIYDRSDAFPLSREFMTSFVFSQGYGAFVCNLRLVDPEGALVDDTREPFAFNLNNRLTDYHVDYNWKVNFKTKGYYKMILTLNGEDVFKRSIYVGHSDDRP